MHCVCSYFIWNIFPNSPLYIILKYIRNLSESKIIFPDSKEYIVISKMHKCLSAYISIESINFWDNLEQLSIAVNYVWTKSLIIVKVAVFLRINVYSSLVTVNHCNWNLIVPLSPVNLSFTITGILKNYLKSYNATKKKPTQKYWNHFRDCSEEDRSLQQRIYVEFW